MAALDLSEVQREIAARGLRWRAGPTNLSDLPLREQGRRLGLVLDEARRQRLVGLLDGATCPLCAFPPAWDWRSVEGKDWTTPVRDQGACGSCVAFAVVGAVESMVRYAGGDPERAVDLSEAHLFFCGSGPSCAKGWWPEEALDYLRNQGVPDETCFRYRDEDMPCRTTCTDWGERAVRISGWKALNFAEERKDWLARTGPLVGAMAVYQDLFYYTGGVYRPVSEELVGYHAVTVVGYDDRQSAWLCKNSWGSGWGEAGWFRLAYGTCEHEDPFPAWAIEQVLRPPAHGTAEPEGRNARARLGDAQRRSRGA
jgi:C1A family cysteine protease